MKFPIYILAKDCGELAKYDSIYEVQGHLESIDIENQEYEAWDGDGTALELGTQRPVWIKIAEKGNDWGGLIRALLNFAVRNGVLVGKEPGSPAEAEALLRSVISRER